MQSSSDKLLHAFTKFSVKKVFKLGKLMGEMAQIIAATVKNECQIS